MTMKITNFLSKKIQQVQLISVDIVSEELCHGWDVIISKTKEEYFNYLKKNDELITKFNINSSWDILNNEPFEVKSYKIISEPDDLEDIKNILNSRIKNKSYYAVCKDFDLKAAWDNEWLRENVLKPIHEELTIKENEVNCYFYSKTSYKDFKRLINKYGKTKKQIDEEIIEFTSGNIKVTYNIIDMKTFNFSNLIKILCWFKHKPIEQRHESKYLYTNWTDM